MKRKPTSKDYHCCIYCWEMEMPKYEQKQDMWKHFGMEVNAFELFVENWNRGLAKGDCEPLDIKRLERLLLLL
jgi:hypothetical protein